MTDRALDFAKYIVEQSRDEKDTAEAVIMEKFGDLNREQVERGLAIAEEILAAEAAGYEAQARSLRDEVARRAAARAA